MANDNRLQLAIEIQAAKAKAQIEGVNQGLAGIQWIAVSVAKNASEGIDGMTASTVNGSLAGDLLAETIKGIARLPYFADAARAQRLHERVRPDFLPACHRLPVCWASLSPNGAEFIPRTAVGLRLWAAPHPGAESR